MKAILRMTIDERRSVVRSGILLWIKEGYKTVAPKLPQISSKSFVCPSYPNGQSGIKFAILDDEVGLRFETSGENEFNRYYGQCVTTRCVYWKGHCQLGAIVATSAERTPESFTLLSIEGKLNNVGSLQLYLPTMYLNGSNNGAIFINTD